MNWSDFRVIFGKNLNELVIINDSISVFISIVNHLINLSSWEVLSDTLCNFFKIFGSEGSLFAKIKIFEKLSNWSFTWTIRVESEDVEEGSEIHLLSRRRWLNYAQNLLSLIFNTKSFDSVNQFFSWDVSTSIIIKDVETFFKLNDSFFIKVFSNKLFWIESLNNDRFLPLTFWIFCLTINYEIRFTD